MLILDKLIQKINTSKQLSDSETLISLIRMGEFITKLTVLSSISSLTENHQKIKYRSLYNVVSADGIGAWVLVLDQIIATAISMNLMKEYQSEKNELLINQKEGDWGYIVISELYTCKKIITEEPVNYNIKLKLKDWFRTFVEIRNDYAHNRIPLSKYRSLIPHLEKSLYTFINNFTLFKLHWVFNYVTSNGATKLLPLDDNMSDIETLKLNNLKQLMKKEGIYFFLENKIPVYVNLLITDLELQDFFIPNGRFTDKKFELISYITSETIELDAKDFHIPLQQLPKSETHGLEKLELIEFVFTNLPNITRKYIERREIEDKLHEALMDVKKWRMITLRGRGGIGKTSTAIEVLKKITNEDRFNAIIWFSARDIDFDQFGGPIFVQPKVLTKDDIANEYAELVEHPDRLNKNFDSKEYFTQQLDENLFGKTLFVFDNFETVERPIELFEWLESFITLPNKILITTRHREFYTDKPIEVEGMKIDEFKKLVISVSEELNIQNLVTDKTTNQLYKISLGHPYVVKILLGEISNTKSTANLNRVFENKEQILQALFERTYDGLRPLSQKIFQILCNWRSVIPEIALEATLVCNPLDLEDGEVLDFDVKDAIDELKRFSFIEILNPKEDFPFINVPLTASFFGLSKLKANPNRSQIQAYTKLLQEFGASQAIHINEGIEPRIKYFFSSIQQNVDTEEEFNAYYLNVVQFLCRRYNKAWLLLADLYENLFKNDEKTKKCLKEYLRTGTNDESKEIYWDRLIGLYSKSHKIEYKYSTIIDKYDYKGCALIKITNFTRELLTERKEGKLDDIKGHIKIEMFKRLIKLIEENSEFPKITANHIGLLGRLYIYCNQFDKAASVAILGLKKEAYNRHCLDILDTVKRRKRN